MKKFAIALVVVAALGVCEFAPAVQNVFPGATVAQAYEFQLGEVTKDGARVRRKPNTSSEVLRIKNKGSQVQIVGKTGDWYKVRHRAANGWEYGYMRSDMVRATGQYY